MFARAGASGGVPQGSARPKTKPRQIPPPSSGWIANQNLARPRATIGGRPVYGAAVLENFFPTATGAIMRRGKQPYIALSGADKVTALWGYSFGGVEQVFASSDTAIYDVSQPTFPGSIEPIMSGFLGGDWSAVQFATTGSTFVIAVNGTDQALTYDGTAYGQNRAGGTYRVAYDAMATPFEVGQTATSDGETGTIYAVIETGLTTGILYLTDVTGEFEDGNSITSTTGSATVDGNGYIAMPEITFEGAGGNATSRLSYVWVYKNRLFFVEKGTLDIWYLPVDQIGGELKKFPMGGVFGLGGEIMFGYGWSLDSGSSGGLSEQCIMVTTEGEVAVFQGSNPSDADDWNKVGVYRIGRPLGKRAFIRAGSDVVIATSVGFMPLSQAISRDYAVIAPAAVSYPIEVAWLREVESREGYWNAISWPKKGLIAVVPPKASGYDDIWMVANASSGAWCKYTDWEATCLYVFKEQLLFGTSTGGIIFQAEVTGLDWELPYTGRYVPLFDDMGAPAAQKCLRMGRVQHLASDSSNDKITALYDHTITIPPPPTASPSPAGSFWDSAGKWDSGVTWDGGLNKKINTKWRSLNGKGYAVSVCWQITSGDYGPMDVEIVGADLLYETALDGT